MDNIEIRRATRKDCAEILDIYRPYILETGITFEYEVPTLEEFEERMRRIMEKYPYLVAVRGQKIVGYAYAHEYRERAAYGWDVESSIYIRKGETRCGAGTLLYRSLLPLLQKQNVQNVYACISLPNEPSVGLHESLGFRHIGTFTQAGYKFDRWYDVVWYEKKIGSFAQGENLEAVCPIDRVDKGGF